MATCAALMFTGWQGKPEMQLIPQSSQALGLHRNVDRNCGRFHNCDSWLGVGQGGSSSVAMHVVAPVLMSYLSQVHGVQGLLGVGQAVLVHNILRTGTGWQQSKQKQVSWTVRKTIAQNRWHSPLLSELGATNSAHICSCL